MLTKKRLALLTVLMTGVYFILLMFLPQSVVGSRVDNKLMFAVQIGFLAMGAAVTTTIILILLFKREFMNYQLKTFKRFKYLLQLMVKRDFQTRYRKSFLGVLWSLLNPLLTMLVMTAVFSTIFRFEIPNFPVYLLSGQLIYGFFSEATTSAMGSVIGGEGIIKKVYVPKYIFPLSKVISSLVNLLFAFIAFLLVFIITGAPFSPTIFLIPIPLIYTFIFALGVAMLLSSLAVFFRDLTYLYGVLLTLTMYLTPLFYPIDILPDRILPVVMLNPLYHFIKYFRNLALYGTIPGLWDNFVCIGFALTAFCFGIYVFMSQQDRHILYL